MNKKVVARIILIILIILNCIFIFKFSSEKSEKSDVRSGRVIQAIVELNPKTKNLSDEEKEKIKEDIVMPVRKTAHFTIYMNLGMLLFLCSKTFNAEDKKNVLGSLTFAFLYACTDEIHQMFVSGRSGEFRDVCIDSCGALFGILIVFFLWKIVKKISK